MTEKIKYIYRRLQMYRLRCKYYFSGRREIILKKFQAMEEKGIKEIPIFIVSFNRLSYLMKMIDSLEKRGYSNIHIIDNNSTYGPLLDYYQTIPYEIIKLDTNEGHMVFWKSSLFDKYRNNFYVLTDPDVIPIEECPDDFIAIWFNILKKHPYVKKVGFSLKIDDLPINAIGNEITIKWEQQFWNIKLNDERIYYADIDTTMALYMPDDCSIASFYRAFRTDKPYQARHLPWYKTIDDITDEDVFYSRLNKFGTWDIPKDYVKGNKKEV